MDSFIIIQKNKEKKVKGYFVGDYFAVRLEYGKGWRITHRPTAHLLTGAGFEERQEAEKIAQIAEGLFGKLLNSVDPAALKEASTKVPGGQEFYNLKLKLDEIQHPITLQEVRELLR